MKEKVLKVLDFVIPSLAGIAIICALFYIYESNKQYSKAAQEYAGIEQMAVKGEYITEKENTTITEDTDTDEPDPYEETFVNLHIDFDSLMEINPDTVGWIYIPELELSYPVLQGEDNSHYLHYTIEGEKNASGSILLDSSVNPNMTDKNTFVYGHNMKNKTMFGSLKTLANDEERLSRTDIYYYTKDHAFKYEVFANYIVSTGSFAYYFSEDNEQLENYLEKVQAINTFEAGKQKKVTGADRIITLSTCSGRNTGRRTILQGYLVSEYKIRPTEK